jgi:hypothetical protein
MIGEIIGAGASILGGLMGSSAEKKAAKQNYEIALKNLGFQKETRDLLIAQALRLEKEQKLGTTDAYGNKYHYVEGQGWVVDLSPRSKAAQDLQYGEEVTQLAQDIPAKRRQMFTNLARQGQEENVAGGLREAFQRARSEDPQDIIARRNLMSAEGINEGADATTQLAMQNAVRTGSSNAGQILSAIGKQRGSDLRRAFMENAEGATAKSQDDYMTKLGNIGNLYNMFASRASGLPDAPYNPRNIEGSANEILGGMRSGASQMGSNLLSAFGRETPQMDYTAQPQYGMANTIAQAGRLLGSAFDNGGGWGSGMDMYGNYASSGGARGADYYKQNTGLW